MNLNEIAENFAYALGRQYDVTFKEAIKFTIKVYRSKLIKDTIERNPDSYESFVQRICLTFDKDDPSLCDMRTENRLILISKETVPQPVVLRGINPFYFVGSVDKMQKWIKSDVGALSFIDELPYQTQNIHYDYVDGKIRVLNNIKICAGVIEAIFDNPLDVSKCDGNKFSDEDPYPISNDLLYYIREMIVKGSFPIYNKDNKEINIKE